MTDAIAPEVEGQATPAPEVEGQAITPEVTPPVENTESNWFSGAEDEVIGYIQNKGWADDPLKAVQSYQELEKYRGVSEDQLLKLPKDMSEEGSMDAIWGKLGRPESHEEYQLDIPEGAQIDEDRISMAREVGHKLGLTNKQLSDLVKADIELGEKAHTEMELELERQQEMEVQNLKREWGAGFEEKAEIGRRFIRENLPEGVDSGAMVDAIERSIGTELTLRLFGNAGQSGVNREDVAPDTTGDRPYGYTKEQASADRRNLMAEIQADPKRLDNYNKGIGPDLIKMKNLNKHAVG